MHIFVQVHKRIDEHIIITFGNMYKYDIHLELAIFKRIVHFANTVSIQTCEKTSFFKWEIIYLNYLPTE